jgi:hypothetical protein
VKDLAAALTVMASIGYDPNDNTTSLRPSELFGINYSEDVFGGSLRGLRFGLLEGFFNRTESKETTPVNNVMNQMVSVSVFLGAPIS